MRGDKGRSQLQARVCSADARFRGLDRLGGGCLLGMKPIGLSPGFGRGPFEARGFGIGAGLFGDGDFSAASSGSAPA